MLNLMDVVSVDDYILSNLCPLWDPVRANRALWSMAGVEVEYPGSHQPVLATELAAVDVEVPDKFKPAFQVAANLGARVRFDSPHVGHTTRQGIHLRPLHTYRSQDLVFITIFHELAHFYRMHRWTTGVFGYLGETCSGVLKSREEMIAEWVGCYLGLMHGAALQTVFAQYIGQWLRPICGDDPSTQEAQAELDICRVEALETAEGILKGLGR